MKPDLLIEIDTILDAEGGMTARAMAEVSELEKYIEWLKTQPGYDNSVDATTPTLVMVPPYRGITIQRSPAPIPGKHYVVRPMAA